MLNKVNDLKLTLLDNTCFQLNRKIKKRADGTLSYFVSHHMSKQINPTLPGPVLAVTDYVYDGLMQQMEKMK